MDGWMDDGNRTQRSKITSHWSEGELYAPFYLLVFFVFFFSLFAFFHFPFSGMWRNNDWIGGLDFVTVFFRNNADTVGPTGIVTAMTATEDRRDARHNSGGGGAQAAFMGFIGVPWQTSIGGIFANLARRGNESVQHLCLSFGVVLFSFSGRMVYISSKEALDVIGGRKKVALLFQFVTAAFA
jgi:hypothetical protein